MPDVFSRAVHDQLTVLPPAENFSGEMTLGVVETYPGARSGLRELTLCAVVDEFARAGRRDRAPGNAAVADGLACRT